MIVVIHSLLICALTLGCPWRVIDSVKPNAGHSVYDRPISSLTLPSNPLYYRGLRLNAEHPGMKYLGAQEALATGEAFPDALSCLAHGPGDDTASLAELATGKFEAMADLETCLQRVGNELGDLSVVKPWLHAVGFGWAEERSVSLWLASNSLGMDDSDVAVFRASWRGRPDNILGRPYPMSLRFRLTKTWGLAPMGMFAKNLDLTLVFRRDDMRVISADVVMIFL